MKKSMWLPLLCLLLTACAPPAEAPAVGLSAGEVARAVLESQVDTAALTPVEGDALSDRVAELWGVAEPWADAAAYAGSGVDGREIAVLLLEEGADVEAAAQALRDYRLSREGDFFGYAPEQSELLKNGRVLTEGRYVALLVCPDMPAARAALESALGGDWTPEPAPSAQPAPEPSIPPTPELSVQPVPGIMPTERPEATAAMATADYPPYSPPGETDMTLYDLEPLLDAWAREDPSGLTEQDAAVYAVCREAFQQVITEGMTDYEKERALHDWLLDQGEYDYTAYDTPDHVGLPHNRNPYGMLVEGYGICLGYAKSFELLARMADLECITVVGAAFRSTGSHAWNMVRLEGEWYCVDATWNDNPRFRHRYFNVTSDFMRETDHQWDYANTPEATATDYGETH